ncbi:MAG: hypothetical protein ACHQ01_03745 [Candidatus Limnocylindrales bacterium]
MQHRHARVLAAVLASSLLVLAGLVGDVAAHNPGHGPGFPGTSAKPLPSGWAWPSDLKPQPVKSHEPVSFKPEPSKSPHPTPTFTCPPVTPNPSPSSSPVGESPQGEVFFGFKGDWDEFGIYLYDQFHFPWAKTFCNVDPLMKALDAQINARINELTGEITQIGKSGLGASDQSTVDGVLNGFIADLGTFKTKVDGETTLTALQADAQTLAGEAHMYQSVDRWIWLIVGTEKLIGDGPGLITLENKIAAEIAAAPPAPETADAQLFLNDMKLAVTSGENLVAPLPATLVAITKTELSNGTANATLASVQVTYNLSWWDIELARWAAFWAQKEV